MNIIEELKKAIQPLDGQVKKDNKVEVWNNDIDFINRKINEKQQEIQDLKTLSLGLNSKERIIGILEEEIKKLNYEISNYQLLYGFCKDIFSELEKVYGDVSKYKDVIKHYLIQFIESKNNIKFKEMNGQDLYYFLQDYRDEILYHYYKSIKICQM